MTILCDKEIGVMSFYGMISPYFDEQVREVDGRKVISYGLSSYGYDARVGNEFRTVRQRPVLAVNADPRIDPKAADDGSFVMLLPTEGGVWLPPNSHTLCATIERFRIPRDVLAICLGKSTYARCGVIVNCTPLEPGWEGQVTLELSNTSPVPVKVYPGEGICQFIFLRGSPCDVSYADRAGKYQGQSGVVLPRL